jgi:hypothetical protein
MISAIPGTLTLWDTASFRAPDLPSPIPTHTHRPAHWPPSGLCPQVPTLGPSWAQRAQCDRPDACTPPPWLCSSLGRCRLHAHPSRGTTLQRMGCPLDSPSARPPQEPGRGGDSDSPLQPLYGKGTTPVIFRGGGTVRAWMDPGCQHSQGWRNGTSSPALGGLGTKSQEGVH